MAHGRWPERREFAQTRFGRVPHNEAIRCSIANTYPMGYTPEMWEIRETTTFSEWFAALRDRGLASASTSAFVGCLWGTPEM